MIDSVNNVLALDYYRSDDGQQAESSNASKASSNFKQFSYKYQLWRGGLFWNSPLILDSFIDALIHFVILGVTKATKTFLNRWVKVTRRTSLMSTITK